MIEDRIDVGTWVCEYDSPLDAAEHAMENGESEGRDYFRHVERRLGSNDYDNFYGDTASSMAEAMDYVRTGISADGVKAADIDAYSVLMQDAPGDMFLGSYDVSGADVDVPMMLMGEPEHMVDYPLTETPKSGKVVHITVPIMANCNVSETALAERGRRVMELLIGLEGIGLQVEVSAVVSIKGFVDETAQIHQYVHLKKAGEWLDPTQLMFAIADPLFFRAFMFLAMYDSPREMHSKLSLGDAFGQSCEPRPYREGSILLPRIMRDADADDDLLGEIRTQLFGE